MNQRMREQLLGYLLDALEDDERDEVERLIDEDPTWREELRVLQDAIEPLAEASEAFDPPPGLAERTSAMVQRLRHAEPARYVADRFFGGISDAGASRSRWSVVDAMVTAGILLIAAMLFFPAIANSRYAARAAQCQNNLRQLGLALASYSDKAGGGYFPWVPPSGNRAFAGVYAPILCDGGYVADPDWFTCPSVTSPRISYEVPTLIEIDEAPPEQLAMYRRMAGGDYGFNLGVVVDGSHRAARNKGRYHFAMMADAPNLTRISGRPVSHIGRTQNVLFEDGHVEGVVIDEIDVGWIDHPFVNRYGYPEAGVDENDSVVAGSSTPPFQYRALSPYRDRQVP